MVNLLTWDILFLVSTLLSRLKTIDAGSPEYVIVFAKLMYPMSHISMSASIYMTIGLSIERYIYINHPMAHKRLMETSNCRIRCYVKYILPITIFFILLNLPHFLIVDVEWNDFYMIDGSKYAHISEKALQQHPYAIDGAKHAEISLPPLTENPYIIKYYINCSTLVINGIVPCLCLIYCMIMVFKKMDGHFQNSDEIHSKIKMEHELAIVSMGIGTVFITCHLLKILITIYETIYMSQILDCQAVGMLGIEMWAILAAKVSTLMLTINASIKIVICCRMNANVRSKLVSCFTNMCKRKGTRKGEIMIKDGKMDTAKTDSNKTTIVHPNINDNQPLINDMMPQMNIIMEETTITTKLRNRKEQNTITEGKTEIIPTQIETIEIRKENIMITDGRTGITPTQMEAKETKKEETMISCGKAETNQGAKYKKKKKTKTETKEVQPETNEE